MYNLYNRNKNYDDFNNYLNNLKGVEITQKKEIKKPVVIKEKQVKSIIENKSKTEKQ